MEQLREAGVTIAISTGCNPGTSPAASLLAAAHLSCSVFGLSPLEAMQGITVAAAKALGQAGAAGELAPGVDADFAVWDAEHPEDLIYWLGAPLCHGAWLAGRPVPSPEPDGYSVSKFSPAATKEPMTS